MSRYAAPVRMTLARLLVLLVVLIMPVGMGPAAATTHAGSMASMPVGHCGDSMPGHDGKAHFTECTMACSAALPAANRASAEPLLLVCTPVLPAVSQALHGLHPETATPPPRHS